MTSGVRLLAMVCSLSGAVTAGLQPLWRRYFAQRGWVDEPGGRKAHRTCIALAGGVAVLSGLIGGQIWSLWYMDPEALRLHGWKMALGSGTAVACALGALAVFLIGWWDDRVELRPLPKLSGQMVIAVATAAFGVRLPIGGSYPWCEGAVTVFFILLVLNAVNFLDNMDGLCAGLSAIAALAFTVIAAARGQFLIANFAAGLTGACLGFLPRNYPRPTVYLGDSGSHLLGYLLAVLAIVICAGDIRLESPGAARSAWLRWAPLLALAVPFIDIVQVVLLRCWRGQPVYIGDKNHVSHHLVRWGCRPTTAVLILWGVGAVAGAGAVLASR